MVFYPDEIEALSVAFERGYKDNGNTACIGLMVNFDLGLRIGELCALKWTVSFHVECKVGQPRPLIDP